MDLTVGQLVLVAFSFVPPGTLACKGATAPVAEWPELAELLGTTFGGDGTTTFGLPNLPAATGLQWLISGSGPSFDSGQEAFLGEVRAMVVAPPAGSSLADTWLPCDGRLLKIDEHVAMYALLGATFGGNGSTTFALPNLAPLAGPTTWWLNNGGQFPDFDCDAKTPQYPGGHLLAAYLASVSYLAYGTGMIDKICGVALSQGQSIPVNNGWVGLFSLIGVGFGGDGQRQFNLPKLDVLGGVTPAIVVNGVYPSRQ